MQIYKLEKEVKNRVCWEKSIKEAKVRIGLQFHRRRRKRRRKKEFSELNM
jgi:hypothetical protein